MVGSHESKAKINRFPCSSSQSQPRSDSALSVSLSPLSLSLRVAFIEIAMRAYAARVGVGVEKRESGTKKRSGSEAPFQSSLRSKYDHSRMNCSILINVERNVVSLMVNAVGL